MREDMFQVIIERPRGGGGPRRPGRPPRDPDDAPRFESSSRNRHGTKWLNENLAPLIRFLRRRVGRPWDKVYSEMAAQLSSNSAVQKHVFDHVRQMVERDVVLVDGKPHRARRLPHRPGPIEDDGTRRVFYVCPATGRLLVAPRRERPRNRLPIDATQEAWRLDGVWYRVRFAPVPARRSGLRDVILKRALDETDMHFALVDFYGRDDRFAVAKEQLSRRELAALLRR